MRQVFISYSSKEAGQANEIVKALEAQGIQCWIAPRDIRVGSNYTKDIPNAIRECSYFLLVLSRESQQSAFVLKELTHAVREEKTILPLILEDCVLNDSFIFFLGNIQIRNYARDPKAVLKEIVSLIKASSPAAPEPEMDPPADLPVVRHVFISHSTADEQEALKIADHLLKQKVICWMAPRDTRSHTSYPAQITQAVRECPIFLLLISKASMDSSHVEREVALSIDRRIYAGTKYIIPLMLEDCTLTDDFYYFLANQHYYPYYQAPDEILAKITEQILQFVRQDESSAAEYLRTARKYDQSSDYREAEKWYRRAALAGNAAAQSVLGYYYHTGKAGTRNIREAMKWYQKAADQGNTYAQANLGVCYAYENTVPKNWGKAAALFRKAADQGHAGAQRHLGTCYENGTGVKKDLTEAKKWYQKAADQGDEYAKQALERLK